MVATVDLLIVEADQVVTPAGTGALCGRRQGALEIIAGGAVACSGRRIVAVGPTAVVRAAVGIGPDTRVIDAKGTVVTPGLIDAHTHLVYAGDRIDEFEKRSKGATYAEILAAGGGIHSTVRATREACLSELIASASRRLDCMLAAGTTTAEVKSGYGLDLETELKQLEAIRALNAVGPAGAPLHPVELVGTFLGAHAVPQGDQADGYLERIVAEVLPQVLSQGVARFCDVFCERGVFTTQQSERLLRFAQGLGLKAKIHADELCDTGGAALAGRIGAVSADHLHHSAIEGLASMARAGTVAVLLPGTGVYLGLTEHARARKMVELEVPVAIGTDLNPGSCTAHSMALMMSLAVCQLKLSPAEALVAATANAACAIDASGRIGRVSPGFEADLVLWDAADFRAISYYLGANLVRQVIKRGQVVYSRV